MCKWNVGKLGEMFSKVAQKAKLDQVLERWDETYKAEYLKCMRAKLGLLTPQLGDSELVTTLCHTMASTKADFTNIFRVLTDHDIEEDDDLVVFELLKQCLSLPEVISGSKFKHSKEECLQLLEIVNMYSNTAGSNPLAMFGIEPQTLINDMETHKLIEKYSAMTQQQKTDEDTALWKAWLSRYKARLSSEPRAQSKATMRANNPAVVPRNHVLQRAIDKAEQGDYTLARRLLEVFEDPYTVPSEPWMTDRTKACQTVT